MTNFTHRWLLPLVLLGAVCTGFGITASAYAESGFKHASRDFGPHRIFRLLHRLDASREQRTQIGAVMDAHRPLMREFMFDMMDGKKALQAILTSDNYDQKQVEELAAAQAVNAEKMFLATAKSFADISAILTADQRKELAAMMEEHEGRWGRGRSDGRHGDREPM
ncbi:MAG: Spy/CpxP family protein refolding chaperone [Gammaproteobacteria bacterium]